MDDELRAVESTHNSIHTIVDEVTAARNAYLANGWPLQAAESLGIQYSWFILQLRLRSAIKDAEREAKQ